MYYYLHFLIADGNDKHGCILTSISSNHRSLVSPNSLYGHM